MIVKILSKTKTLGRYVKRDQNERTKEKDRKHLQ